MTSQETGVWDGPATEKLRTSKKEPASLWPTGHLFGAMRMRLQWLQSSMVAAVCDKTARYSCEIAAIRVALSIPLMIRRAPTKSNDRKNGIQAPSF